MTNKTPIESLKDHQVELRVIPLYDRVLVKPLELNEITTKNGIIVPMTKKNSKFIEAVVVAQGPGLWLESKEYKKMHTKIGDRILFSRTAGIEFVIGNEKLLMLREIEIQAILETQDIV